MIPLDVEFKLLLILLEFNDEVVTSFNPPVFERFPPSDELVLNFKFLFSSLSSTPDWALTFLTKLPLTLKVISSSLSSSSSSSCWEFSESEKVSLPVEESAGACSSCCRSLFSGVSIDVDIGGRDNGKYWSD